MVLDNVYKNIRFAGRIVKSNFSRLDFPYKLTLALTYKCNLMCKTCNIWRRDRIRELSLNELESFFKKSNSFHWIDLTGGEIFTREDLSDVVRVILDNCRFLNVLHFPVNGQMTNKVLSLSKEIKKHKRNVSLVITVSLDGPPEINDEIKGKKGAWIKSLKTFIKLKEIGIKFTYLGYTMTGYNQGKLQDTISKIKEVYPKVDYSDFHVNIFQKSRHYFNNLDLGGLDIDDPIKAELELSQYKKQCGKGIKKILERRFVNLVPDYVITKKTPVSCQALSCSCFIDPYGDIYPCTIFDKRLSNIKDINNDLYGFWNADLVVNTRKDIMDKKCIGCWTPCEACPAILGSLFKRFLDMKFKKVIKNR